MALKTKTYAEICVKQGELAEAVTIYRALVQKTPKNVALVARLRELEQILAAGDITPLEAPPGPADEARAPVTPTKAPPAARPTAAPGTRDKRLARLEKLLYRVQARRRKGAASS